MACKFKIMSPLILFVHRLEAWEFCSFLPISRSLLHREQQAAVPSVVISGCSEMYRHQDRLTLKAHQDGRKKRDAFLPEVELIF